jgi:predicted transcriptional regulator
MASGRAGGKATKDMVLRLDPELAERLRLVADVEGRSISDVAREAISQLVERRRRDKRFRRLLEDRLARHQQALRLLADDAAPDESADTQHGGVA